MLATPGCQARHVVYIHPAHLGAMLVCIPLLPCSLTRHHPTHSQQTTSCVHMGQPPLHTTTPLPHWVPLTTTINTHSSILLLHSCCSTLLHAQTPLLIHWWPMIPSSNSLHPLYICAAPDPLANILFFPFSLVDQHKYIRVVTLVTLVAEVSHQ